MNAKPYAAAHLSMRLQAFSLLDLLVVLAILAVTLTVLLPAFNQAPHHASRRLNCTNNLKQIGLAFITWSLDNSDRFPMHVAVTNGGTWEMVAAGRVFPHFQVASNELSTPRILGCPEDTGRTAATNWANDFTDSKLSYFLGVDAVERNASSILSGDRNLTNQPTAGNRLLTLTTNSGIGWTTKLHSRQGNLLFADGSVRLFSNKEINNAQQPLWTGTNRLAVP